MLLPRLDVVDSLGDDDTRHSSATDDPKDDQRDGNTTFAAPTRRVRRL